jgi:UPF0755 protein
MIAKLIWKPRVYIALLSLGFGIAGITGWRWWNWASAPLATASTPPHLITIPQGTGSDQIGQQLEQAGIIRSALAWQVWNRYLRSQKTEGGVQAGTYEISPGQSLQQVTDQIWHGKVVQQSFTVPEGWSIQKIAIAFEKQGFFPATDFIKATQSIPREKHPWLPVDLPHLEGYLYPDTYLLPRDQMTPENVIDQMLTRFEEVALPLYQRQQGQTLTLKEWVNLSSIVEKEAVIAPERPVIAGVFLRRLKLGMTLGSDPTVEYGLNIQQTEDKPLTLKQVNTPTPYNTYKNAGLPPTPIANPGVASLKAVLEPQTTPYLYFMARYDGSHIFSRTLAEHESAQRMVRDRQDS